MFRGDLKLICYIPIGQALEEKCPFIDVMIAKEFIFSYQDNNHATNPSSRDDGLLARLSS